MRYTAIVLWCTGLLLVLGSPVLSGTSSVPKGLEGFFAPISMNVVMQVEDGYIVNKGSEDGVNTGDILSIVGGEKILRDPVNGKVIDKIVDYKGYLIVTKARPKLSYGRFLGGLANIADGTEVRRFENVPVYFEDIKGKSYQTFQDLRQGMPNLLWKKYSVEPLALGKKAKPFLVLKSTEGKLTLLNSENDILFVQPYSVPTVIAAPPARPTTEPVTSAQAMSFKKIVLPEEEGMQALRLADFDQDGKVEVLLGYDRSIRLGRLDDGKFVEIKRFPFTGQQRLAGLSVIDLDTNGVPEIEISLVEGTKVVTKVYSWSGQNFKHLLDLRMLTGTYQLSPAEEILIAIRAKAVSKENNPKFYRITMKDGKINRTLVSLAGVKQPYGVVNIGSTATSPLNVAFAPSGKLKVLDRGGKLLWETSESYGGSTRGLKVPQPGAKNTNDYEKYFFYSTILSFSPDHLLVSQHDGSGWMLNFPKYKKGRLVEMVWKDGSLEEVSKTKSLGGMIADFTRYDLNGDGTKEMVALVVYREKGLFKPPVSGLVIIN